MGSQRRQFDRSHLGEPEPYADQPRMSNSWPDDPRVGKEFRHALLGYMHVLMPWVEHVPSLKGDGAHHMRIGTYLLGSLHKTTEGLEFLAGYTCTQQDLAMCSLQALKQREAVNVAHSTQPALDSSLRAHSQKLIDLLARLHNDCPELAFA